MDDRSPWSRWCTWPSGSPCGCTPGRRARRRTRCAAAATPRSSCGSSSGRRPRSPTGRTRSSPPRCSTRRGINLLAQTSVTGLSLPLVPVTWIWGPVASLNVAVHPHAGPHRVHRLHRHAALGPLDAGRLRRRAALRLLALRADQPRVRAPHDRRAHGAPAHPDRARRDPDPPAPQRGVVRRAPRPPRLRAVLPLHRAAGHHGPVVVVGVVGPGGRRADLRPGRRCGGWPPTPPPAWASGFGVGVVLLAWPVWFALEGPAHLSGLVWPNVDVIGGYIPSSFVAPGYPMPHNVFLRPRRLRRRAAWPRRPISAGRFLAVLAAGLVAFWRDRRLWFFGFMLVVCGVCSLGIRRGPVGAGPALRPHAGARERDRATLHGDRVPRRRGDAGHRPRPRPRASARLARRARCAGAVGRCARADGAGLRRPSALRDAAGDPARAGTPTVAPTLPPGRVLLSYPAPFSGIQSAMAWQAVNRMHYSQAGGGGPQGVARAGRLGRRRVQGADRPGLGRGRGPALGHAGTAGRGAPRAGACGRSTRS